MVVHLRTAGATGVVSAIRRLDADLELQHAETLEHAVEATLRRERMLGTSISLFAGIALFLSAVGLYGTMAYAAARRTSEIGVRVALGATRLWAVLTMMHEAAVVIAAGVAVGLPLASLGVRSLWTLLYGLEPLDPISFGGGVLLLSAVALVAALLPAHAAASVPPMSTLRHE